MKALSVHISSNTSDYLSMSEEQLAMNFWGRIEQAQKLEKKYIPLSLKKFKFCYIFIARFQMFSAVFLI